MSLVSLRVKASGHQGVRSLHSVAWAHLVGDHTDFRALQCISRETPEAIQSLAVVSLPRSSASVP